jgi:hypothetical protein
LKSKSELQPVVWGTVWLAVPAWLMLAVEFVGEWRFEKGQNTTRDAFNFGSWYNALAVIAFTLLAVSPFLIAFGLSRLFEKSDFQVRKPVPRRLLLLLGLSLLVSLFSCLWTCGGHPTWTGGYTQH